MGPKKGAVAGEDGAAEDISCQHLWKAYYNNCKMLEVPANKQIKTLYDTKWLEDNEPIKKVSSGFVIFFC
jgi:hypothetical protein